MADTGEDEDIEKDTEPISVVTRLWSRWEPLLLATHGSDETWVVSDRHVNVPARSGAHAKDLAIAMNLAEMQHAPGSRRLARARGLVFFLAIWCLARDPRARWT